MDAYYPVYFGGEQVGKVQVIKQGLYNRFICRCRLAGDKVCRLYVRCGESLEKLGVLVPVDEGFGLDTRIPAKRFADAPMEFELRCAEEKKPEKTFVPIIPEEPFSYLSRLKNAFLVKQAGKIGIILPK